MYISIFSDDFEICIFLQNAFQLAFFVWSTVSNNSSLLTKKKKKIQSTSLFNK